MKGIWFDLAFSLRLLSRSPGYAALCVLVIALALAQIIAIYLIVRVNGVAPLPLPKGDRYMTLALVLEDSGHILRGDQFRAYTLQALQRLSESYELIEGARLHGSLTVNDGERTEAPWGTEISPALMKATGVKPFLGRLMTEADAQLDAADVVMVGYQFWQRFFNGREDIIGHTVRVAGEEHRIIGVLPEGYSFPSDQHIWRPLRLDPNGHPSDRSPHFTPVGILKPGVSMAQAGREAAEIVAGLQQQYPEEYKNLSATSIPYVDAASATSFGRINVIMLLAAIAVLFLACMNVGNLLLVRASERSHELAVRSALGGSRLRIVRQVMMESLLVCLVGGALGLWLAGYAARFCQYQAETIIGSDYLPFWLKFQIGTDALLVSVAALTVLWVLAGGIPAWRASGASVGSALGGGSKGVVSRGNLRTISAFVGAEVVFSFFLLTLSGAFVASVIIASNQNLGINAENRVGGMFFFNGTNYESHEQRLAFMEAMIEEIEREPGVVSATYTLALPGMGWGTAPFNRPDSDLADDSELPMMQLIPVDNEYMAKTGMQLLKGRHFDHGDQADSEPVAIIARDMAEKYWPGESPLGKKLIMNPEGQTIFLKTKEYTVVGVVEPIDQGQIAGYARGHGTVYTSLSQESAWFGYFLVHYAEMPKDREAAFRRAASRVDRDMSYNRIEPLDGFVTLNARMLQAFSELFMGVALVALVLAGTGIYGVVSRSVQLRTREMGIRRALGQGDRQTLTLFLRQGSYFLIAGAFLGGIAAALAGQLLTSEFPSLMDSMGLIVIIVCLLMTALVLGASYIPARRIVALEPASALHHH